MSRSGGVPYHLKAWRYRRTCWESHLEGTRAFLESWNPPERSLILIGPSAGYSLPTEWFARFDRILAFEPDRLGRYLFERDHGLKPEWVGSSFAFGAPRALDVARDPAAAVLFSNLLGQIPIRGVGSLGRWLKTELEGRNWASFHDVLSGKGVDFDTEDAGRKRVWIPEWKRRLHVRNPGRGRVELLAHEGPDLFADRPDLEYRYWQWRLTPEHTFLTEGVFPKKMNPTGDEAC